MSVKIALAIFAYTLVKFINTSNMSGFIVGGNYSAINAFPYAVYISKNCSNKNSSCGGSILTQELLISAAHCYVKCTVPWSVNAYVGAVEKFHGFESKVVDFKTHEEYDQVTKANDIALLRLETVLTFGNAVKRVALMKTLPEYEDAIVAGWGWIDSIGTRDSHLKHTYQEVLDYETCTSKLDSIPEGTICGREKHGVSYPEKGDSGSALVIHNYIQIGLVSFKKRLYTNDTIIYTNVTYFYDWIIDNANKLLCSNGAQVLIKKINTTPSPHVNCSLYSFI